MIYYLFPQIINPDQSSFMKARHASDNIQRLLNIIDHSTLHNNKQLYYFHLTLKKQLIGSSCHTCLPFWRNLILVKNALAGSELCIATHKPKYVLTVPSLKYLVCLEAAGRDLHFCSTRQLGHSQKPYGFMKRLLASMLEKQRIKYHYMLTI